MHCPIASHECATPDCQTHGCALQRGAAYSQLQPAADEHSADVQEAHSLKYHHCAQVFQLSSGKFALFGAYSVRDSGIPLIAIGTWGELEEHVRNYRVLADAQAPTQHRRPLKPTADISAYDNLFGEQE